MLPEFFPDDDFANVIFWTLAFLTFLPVALWWILFIIGTVEQVFLYLRKKTRRN